MKKYSITKMVLLFLIILIPLSDSGFNVRADESEYYNRIKLGLSYFRKVYERIQYCRDRRNSDGAKGQRHQCDAYLGHRIETLRFGVENLHDFG